MSPKRGPISAMTPPLTISLIAAGPEKTVPRGVPVSALRLPSLEQRFVRDWISEYRGHDVYVVTGQGLETAGTPALAIRVGQDEYLKVAAAMSR